MKYFILLFSFILFATSHAKIPESNREDKLFSLFTIVNFKNDPCQSTDTSSSSNTEYRNGTCYTSSECTDKGGSAKGKCAAGFGICCVFTIGRDDDSTQEVNYNDTYIQNPGYPTVYTDTSTLSYTVNKCQDDICWVRLDFDTFVLASQTDEISTTDGFAISESENLYNYPTLAGTNSGQHVYVELGSSNTATASLMFTFSSTTTSTSRSWDIRVSQYTCYDSNTPYQGCFQWFTGLTGRITTFNYGGDTDNIHLPNQNYRACVRQEEDYCCVKYSVCSDTNAYDFNLDQGFLANANAPVNTLGKTDTTTAVTTYALIGTYCTTNNNGVGGLANNEDSYTGDYITIAGAASTCSRTDNANGNQNYCGTHLNTGAGAKKNIDICDCTPLFGIRVHTDSTYDYGSPTAPVIAPTTGPSGVCLDYTHVPCNQR